MVINFSYLKGKLNCMRSVDWVFLKKFKAMSLDFKCFMKRFFCLL